MYNLSDGRFENHFSMIIFLSVCVPQWGRGHLLLTFLAQPLPFFHYSLDVTYLYLLFIECVCMGGGGGAPSCNTFGTAFYIKKKLY